MRKRRDRERSYEVARQDFEEIRNVLIEIIDNKEHHYVEDGVGVVIDFDTLTDAQWNVFERARALSWFARIMYERRIWRKCVEVREAVELCKVAQLMATDDLVSFYLINSQTDERLVARWLNLQRLRYSLE